jgi:hypothetical protein
LRPKGRTRTTTTVFVLPFTAGREVSISSGFCSAGSGRGAKITDARRTPGRAALLADPWARSSTLTRCAAGWQMRNRAAKKRYY